MVSAIKTRYNLIRAKFKVIFANVGLCSFAALGFGYDYVWWGSILGSAYFNEFYGELEVVDPATGATFHQLSTRQTSAGTGIGTVGLVIGAMATGYFNERFGRKRSIVWGVAVLGLVGTFVQAISVIPRNYWVCVVGKMIINASLGAAYAIVPLYMGECAPPEARGAFMAIYTIVQGLGVLVGGGVIYGVIFERGLINFLLPICLQAAAPIVLILVVPFFTPESPRWLATKGRLDEAVEVLDYLRPRTDISHDQHVKEIAEMKASYDHQKQAQSQNGWIELWKGRNLKRTLTIVGAQSLQQAQGASFLNSYLVVTFLSVGLTDVYVILLGVYTYGLGIAVACLFLPDYLGRRTLLLYGSVLMFVGLVIVGAIGGFVDQPTGHLANFMIAAIFVWFLGFSGGWGSTIWVVNGELPSRAVAEKSAAVGAASQFSVNVIVTFVAPYIQNPGYGNLGPKVCFIFAGFCVFAWLLVFFTVPETKGRSLDEIDYMFENGVKIRQFGKYDCTGLVAPDGSSSQDLELAEANANDKKVELEHIEDSVSR